ncbi:MAG: T9SS type A sorting domain-containing protein [Chitinophagaceae bacterium]|nr:T9SS type A sorting domain-containing protein [Chitinophagaceae bacterium]
MVLQVKGTIDEINKAVNNNLNQLSAGIYLLQLSNETRKYQAKLIRQ